jgi:N4-gp56 family major capsid protein
MALGTNHIITTEVTSFIPDIWSDEVVASYKKNLVAAGLVRKLSHAGKKGDTIKIPTPSRGSASDKGAEAQVTLIQAGTDATVDVSISNHKEYSRLIEDIVSVQALESLRRFYTDDAGYAIAKQVDKDILVELMNKSGASLTYDAASNELTTASTFPTIYEGDGATWDETTTVDITDAGLRSFVKLLDDADAPMDGRHCIVPTIVKQDLLGTARFTETQFVGESGAGNSIRNGLVGDAYGVDFYVTTNLPLVEDSGATGDNALGYMFQEDALVFVEQLGVRSQSQSKLEYLGDLFVTDTIYGVKLLRDDSVVPFVVPTT